MTGLIGMRATLHVTPDDRGSYWAGWVEEMGSYVYAGDMSGLLPRAQDLFSLLAHSFDSSEELRAYLDRQGIEYTTMEHSKPQEFSALV